MFSVIKCCGSIRWIMLLLAFTVGCAAPPSPQVVTATFAPTSTYESRWPATITPKPYQTRTPPPTRSPMPTLFPLEATAYAHLQECHDYAYDISQVISPDRQWFVVTCEFNGHTRVARFDGTQEWLIPSIDNGVADNGEPFNRTYYKFYRWSVDGKHVYLSQYTCCIDGIGLVFIEAFRLYRFNIETGAFDAEYNHTRFALSHDERYYAYSEGGPPYRVIIRDLNTLEQRVFSFKEKYQDVGMFKWSPDGKNLIFVAGLEGWADGIAGFSIFAYNLETRQLKLLIDQDLRQLNPLDEYGVDDIWLDHETIFLGELFGKNYWTLNVRTGELTPYTLPKP